MGGAALADGIDPLSIQKNSSLSTVFGLVNSMVGGTMLLLPTLCIQAGLLTTALILMISCFVSYTTCAIFTKHMKLSELDVQWPIKRILGKYWYAFFVTICTIYLFFLCQLYYVLIIQMLYSIICFFLHKAGQVEGVDYVDPTDEKAEFTLNMFSQQWIMIGTFFPIMAMLFMKNLNLLVKIAEIGVYAIYSYMIFIVYCFIDNLSTGTVSSGDQKIEMFTLNIGNLGGTAALAFTIHTSYGNMIKCNKDQSKNVRDLGYTYIIGYFVYTIIAIMGAYGILNRKPDLEIKDLPSMVTEYFGQDNVGPLIVQFLYFGHLISILPIFFDIMKRRALPLFYGTGEKPKHLNTILNISFVCLCFAIRCIPGISPDQITNFNGSLCCFFFVYMIPICMHLVCYHGTNPFLKNVQRKLSRFTEHKPSMDEDEDDDNDEFFKIQEQKHKEEQEEQNNTEDSSQLKEKLIEKDIQLRDQDTYEISRDSGHMEDDESEHVVIHKRPHHHHHHGHGRESCAPHDDIDENTLCVRLVFYGVIMLIGLCVLVYGMYTIIAQF